jgi:hypothetical protein
MILETLLGVSLFVSASLERPGRERPGYDAAAPMSVQQKNAAVRPVVRSATECVARSVSADPRFGAADPDLNELIVASMESCADAMRAMIDAYDRVFGVGAGEAFFTGPYLDVLPGAVHKVLDSGGVDPKQRLRTN